MDFWGERPRQIGRPWLFGRSRQEFWPVTSKVRGRSPQKSMAVHPKSPWPFTPKVHGRSPQKSVAVHPKNWWPFAVAVHPKILTKGVNGQSIGRSFGPGPNFSIGKLSHRIFSFLDYI